jgi:hypothetical protein
MLTELFCSKHSPFSDSVALEDALISRFHEFTIPQITQICSIVNNRKSALPIFKERAEQHLSQKVDKFTSEQLLGVALAFPNNKLIEGSI